MFTAVTIIGSLGLFLFGMRLMSDNIQKFAGEKLRRSISSLTQERGRGVLTGTLITVLMQSSSATTVMVVSFVNAGLLQLRQAIGVIMGANLGTTATFWLVSYVGFKFSLSSIALPAIGMGMVLYYLKSNKAQEGGQTLIGFGLLFLGLSQLKNAVPDFQTQPEVFAFIQNYTDMGPFSVLLFLGFGVLLAIIVQSSSVAGTITLTMAYKGWIDYEMAAAIVLGGNIGTTLTALLASIGGKLNAKRAALAHLIFNLIGVCWMLLLFYPALNLVDYLMPGEITAPEKLPEHLALFHTFFNLCNIVLLIGFVPQLEKLVTRFVSDKPSSPKKQNTSLNHLTTRFSATGEINILEAQQQVSNLAQIAEEMFEGFTQIYQSPKEDLSEEVKRLKDLEEDSDELDNDITQYLVKCSTSELSVNSATRVTMLLQTSSELEDICDNCYRLILLVRRRYRKERDLEEETQRAILLYSRQVLQFIQFVRQCLDRSFQLSDLETAQQLENSINESRKILRKKITKRMEETGDVKAGLLTLDIVNHCEKIGNHAYHIIQGMDTIEND